MYLVIILLGIIFGSFINALVWRLYLKSKKNHLNNPDESIFKGRSMCPNCKHKLTIIDLIPIISWMYLRGKCRYCHKPISLQYPVVELLTGLLFFLSYRYWPFTFNSLGYLMLAIWLVILIVFVSLALYDVKYKLLPNSLVYIALSLSIIFEFINYINYNHTLSFIISRLLGVIFSSGIFYLIFMISNGKWIGGGDVKLCFSLGLILGGPLEAILMIFIASLLGSFISFLLLILGKFRSNMTIAFGPLLLVGTFICLFFGPQIINWYSSLV
jgi:prepilin signal peptidase PulO-like enzyme (type II secretory pathway)